MAVKEAALSPEVVEYLSELRKYRSAKPRGEVRDYYVMVPYKEIRNDGSESKEFLFYARVSEANLEEAKRSAQGILGRSCMSHKMDGHIQSWTVDEARIREALPKERKLCTDCTIDSKF